MVLMGDIFDGSATEEESLIFNLTRIWKTERVLRAIMLESDLSTPSHPNRRAWQNLPLLSAFQPFIVPLTFLGWLQVERLLFGSRRRRSALVKHEDVVLAPRRILRILPLVKGVKQEVVFL